MCVCVMYMCVRALGPVERVHLSAPMVVSRQREVNLTAVVWPSHSRTLTFFWWFDNSSEVTIAINIPRRPPPPVLSGLMPRTILC